MFWDFFIFSRALPMPVLLALALVMGAAVGSFITLVTYRLPRDEKIGATRSRCPKCGAGLKLPDLVPMLSWVHTKGKCRHCKAKISVRYPLTELATALGTMAITWHYGQTLEALALIGLWWGTVALIITDLEHYIILDEVQIALALFALLYNYALQLPFVDAFESAALGAAIGLTLKYGFLYLRNKDGLGLGDVKFLFVAGLWLANPYSFVPFLFYSGVLGVVLGILWQRVVKSERFPFGPALAASLLICVITPQIAQEFWNLFGLLQESGTP